jgi:hypothetical protein
MSEQKVQAKGDEFTDTMGEVYPFYSQQPWQIADDWDKMNRGQRWRYGLSHGLETFGGWPGAMLGQAMRLPVAHMFRKMFGKGDGKGKEEKPFGWNFPTDYYRAAGPPGGPPGGWGSGYGVLSGDPTRPMTPGMAGFLGGHAGGMTNPFGYNTGGWEDSMIAGRGGVGKIRRGGSGGVEGIKHLR